ncbi:hypothetical protein EV126DRAFT_194308 [Verticillium dahliae]|nr:hypothetical protein EV126DRAFT_194308 [Verticillium dahliae]
MSIRPEVRAGPRTGWRFREKPDVLCTFCFLLRRPLPDLTISESPFLPGKTQRCSFLPFVFSHVRRAGGLWAKAVLTCQCRAVLSSRTLPALLCVGSITATRHLATKAEQGSEKSRQERHWALQSGLVGSWWKQIDTQRMDDRIKIGKQRFIRHHSLAKDNQ